MKFFSLILAFACCAACNQKNTQEFAFRETLKYQLIKQCDDDKECANAVKTQTQACMEKGNWFHYVNNQEDEAEEQRFITVFYSCIVDSEGNPYFGINTGT